MLVFACMLIIVPRFGHVFMSRRRATGGAPVPVPGAAVFRALLAAAGAVRGRQV